VGVAVLVDDLVTYPLIRTRSLPGRQWCHMVSDTSFEELHAMAAALGLPRIAFQGDHYDLTPSLRSAAVMLGAQPVDGRELARRRVRTEPRRPRVI
jgi:hypothetical protein